MELDAAAAYRLDVPLAGEYSTSHGTESSQPSHLAVLSAPDGTRGVGTADAGASDYYNPDDEIQSSLADDLLPAVLDGEPQNPNELRRLLGGREVAREAKLAVEMAYLDLYGRVHDLTAAELFGGRLRNTVPLNGWVGIDDPDAMAAESRRLREAGFASLKIKLSGDPDADVARVEAVCDAVADGMQVRADANTAYDVATAIDVARRLEAYPVAHFEQPIPGDDLEGLARVTAATDTTIMADESLLSVADVRRAIELDAADRFKLKILRLGGIGAVRVALDLAGAYGISCVIGHGFCTLPAASAELQLAATHDNVFGAVETVGTLKMAREPFASPLAIADGAAILPDGPGLDVDLLDDELEDVTADSTALEA